MLTRTTRSIAALAVAAALVTTVGAQSTTRVSVDSVGVQGNGASIAPSISADGHFVTFMSQANNLVPGDTNGTWDVFVRDCLTGSIARVSVASNGAEANGFSVKPSISADGKRVAFCSFASNLVASDQYGYYDIFVNDRQTGQTTLVSINAAGTQGYGNSEFPSISADGRYVAFMSYAPNLVPNDTNSHMDVFVHDCQAGQTVRASVGPMGVQANADTLWPLISADGRLVVFESTASNLVLADSNGTSDVFTRNLVTGVTARASINSHGVQGNAGSFASSVSADGVWIVFGSLATNLVTGDANSTGDLFVHSLETGRTTIVSIDCANMQGDLQSPVGSGPSISADGRFVAFPSQAQNLVLGDTNAAIDVFVRDCEAGYATRVSIDPGGNNGNGDSVWPVLSGDGRYVAFSSTATNLVTGDTNLVEDVFIYDQGAISAGAYCTAGTTSSGCVPSISSEGTASATAADGFDLVVHFVEGGRIGLVFFGLAPSAALWATGGSSFRCVAYPVQRTSVQNSGGTMGQCDGELRVDFNAWITANPGGVGYPFFQGEVFYAQGWFRDSGAPKGTNLSDGLRFTLCN